MAVIPIYNCYHPVMKKATEKVENIDGEIKQLVDDMYETMYNIGNGVGLAANQVGQSKSLLIMDISVGAEAMKPQPITMINPIIEEFSEEEEEDFEGCLSIPTYYEKVKRSESVKVRFTDIDEKEHVLEADGFLARVIQHEIDHLHGKLMIERISPIRRTLTKNKLKKIERGKILLDYPMILPNGKLINPE